MPLLATAAMTAALAALQPAMMPVDLSEPTRVSASADGSALVVEGPITGGAYARFERALRAYPIARHVILESPGGLMFEADKIAAAVRERRMSTYARTMCASACTVILIAGRDRTAEPGTRVGFHRPDVSLSRTPARTLELTRRLYERAGLAPAFTARIYATPFESVWYPGVDEMISAGVLTRRLPVTHSFAARRSARAGG